MEGYFAGNQSPDAGRKKRKKSEKTQFVKATEVNGKWERGYSAAQTHFSSLIEAAAKHALHQERKIEGLRNTLMNIAADDSDGKWGRWAREALAAR